MGKEISCLEIIEQAVSDINAAIRRIAEAEGEQSVFVFDSDFLDKYYFICRHHPNYRELVELDHFVALNQAREAGDLYKEADLRFDGAYSYKQIEASLERLGL